MASSGSIAPISNQDMTVLKALEQKILWLASWTIHNANHLRHHADGLKVGGHQASSASLSTILATLYFHILRPEDRVAVKPHASPVFHAIQYLMGNQTVENLENFRGYKGAQSYPSRTKDIDDVDFSTGSVGLGVSQTLFSSMVQDYVHAHGWAANQPKGRMVALIGDAELDEGNIFESILEGWKHGLQNCWWIIDYNRQSLDAVIREGLWERYEETFRNFGWDVVVLKYGELLQAITKEPGGSKITEWIDKCPNQLYSALVFQGGAAWRKRLMDDLGDQGDVTKLLERHSDDELARLMTNLAGHDQPTLLKAFSSIDHTRPVCFICYTIKGHGLPLAGHKDNHSGLMTPAQMETFRTTNAVRPGHEWDKFEGLEIPENEITDFLGKVPFFSEGRRRFEAPYVQPPAEITIDIPATVSTQAGFGQLMNKLGQDDSEFVKRIVTTSPDVTVSTNLGAWVNRRGLFARENIADVFKKERVPSTYNWTFNPTGQHIELGIAESNLFLVLSALGLSYSIHGERLIPIGTLYDPFISRGLDAMNYACYQDARFILAATPSGISLSAEGGAHQSIGTPLIGMSQPGLAYFEPAYLDELAVVLAWSFEHVQRHGDAKAPITNALPDDRGGSVYLRLSTRPLEQPKRIMTPELKQDIIDGAYWMRPPGPNCETVIAYTGTVAPEAIAAAGLMSEDRRYVGLLAITSADRLYEGWNNINRVRDRGHPAAKSHIEEMLSGLPRHCTIISVIDGHPSTLAWLGSVHGHAVRPLGVTQFGQTGNLQEVYKHYGIDTDAILSAANFAQEAKKPIRYA